MTVKQSYKLTLIELQCIKNRKSCNKDCPHCPYFQSPRLLEEAMQFNIALLKAKDPFLYLEDDISTLKEVLKNVTSQSSET